MKRIIAIAAAAALLAPPQAEAASLAKKWQTDQVFSTPESVVYDAERHILYVSNIDGSPSEIDGKGFISRLSMDGELKKLKWIKGLDAPKGMGVVGDRLFVADIDHLAEIDIRNDKVVGRYRAEGALFLNDIAVDKAGNVYISDSSRDNSAIYRFSGGKLELWLKDKLISRPNGLFVDEDRLIVGVSGDGLLRAVDLGTKEISDVHVIGSGIDGVAMDGRGNFLVSDWRGKTVIVDRSGGIMVLLDTTSDSINAADIAFIDKYRMLVIPTFNDNRVVACTLRY